MEFRIGRIQNGCQVKQIKMSYQSLTTWLLFLFILDTGGWIGLRPVVIALLILISVIRFKPTANLKPIFAWVALIILMTPSIFAGESAGVSLSDAMPFIYPILVFPFFYFRKRYFVCNKRLIH